MGRRVVRGVRPIDAVVAGVLGTLGVLVSLVNVTAYDPAVRVDSRSWLQVPVLVAAMMTVLWWRRGLLGVAAASAVLLAAHVVAFGALVRCGAGLPLAFVLAFLSGIASPDRRRRLAALGLAVGVAVLVLVRDTAAGLETLPLVALLQAGLHGAGRLAVSRSAMAEELRRRNEDLRRLRDERAALEVGDDRLQLAARLEALLDERLGQLAAAAERGTTSASPERTRPLLVELESGSRRTLEDMREVVGLLRGGEVALAPTPSVAHLDALLARHLPGAPRLRVRGDPRVLPASVELSAYRIVEHLVEAVAEAPGSPVDVAVTFADDALEILVAGRVPRAAALRAAAGRARERALLHAGSLEVTVARGRARVLARLPVRGG